MLMLASYVYAQYFWMLEGRESSLNKFSVLTLLFSFTGNRINLVAPIVFTREGVDNKKKSLKDTQKNRLRSERFWGKEAEKSRIWLETG